MVRSRDILSSLEFLTAKELKEIKEKTAELLKSGDHKTDKTIGEVLKPYFDQHPECKYFNLGGYGRDEDEFSYEVESGYDDGDMYQSFIDDEGEDGRPSELFLDLVLCEEDSTAFSDIYNKVMKTKDFPIYDSNDADCEDPGSACVYIYCKEDDEVQDYYYYSDTNSSYFTGADECY